MPLASAYAGIDVLSVGGRLHLALDGISPALQLFKIEVACSRASSTLINGHLPMLTLTWSPLQLVATMKVRLRLLALRQNPHKIRSRRMRPSLAVSL